MPSPTPTAENSPRLLRHRRDAIRFRSPFLALITILALCSAGCAQTRSVANYCSTFYGEGEKFRQSAYDAQESGDDLAVVSSLLGAPAQLASFFEKLEAVSPDEIQPDVAQMRDVYKKISDQVGEGATTDVYAILGQLAGGIVLGLSVRAAEQRINEYTLANCGPPPSSASTSSSPASQSSSATEPDEALDLTPIPYPDGPVLCPTTADYQTVSISEGWTSDYYYETPDHIVIICPSPMFDSFTYYGQDKKTGQDVLISATPNGTVGFVAQDGDRRFEITSDQLLISNGDTTEAEPVIPPA